ncbi:YihY/virulence factor BrkB family protein [Pyxidicoccus fallax]|uniref:YihY/virulence factor BrkB family protein n=1 Tax=Pyxidicoccus fallax TaxID=394095 RepID=A0A848L885_9BACT|nr:YihY/virulence factor BrkB family protein [Pyxidicoccus fallax]NMO15009.1 YihY/virulence factor BrkB family protein [Pyxidicoccus fallax]NPC83841.1 YihY/virulence factor BrkB family protein [Pyxidicoccus fallax]
MVLPGKGMSWMEFFKALKAEWTRDDVGDVAGALTFRAILALFPFLLFLVSLAGVLIDPAQAQVLIQELGKVAPQEVTKILGDRITSLAQSNPVGLLTVGGVGAVWAASGGMVALMDSLNTVYGVEEKRPFWKVRGIALLMTLGGAVVAIAAALAVVVTPAIADKLGPLGTVLTWLRLPIAGVVMMFLWAVLYYVLPDVKQKFRFITPGSVVGVLIWVVASWGFSKYVANFGSYDVNYGAIGGVIVMLLWMWISAQVILLGAEINAILEHRSPDGKAPGQKLPEEGKAVTATKGELEEAGARLPGSREFRPVVDPRTGQAPAGNARPPKLAQTPLAAAARWVAGLGLGLFLVRRNTAR